MKEKKSLGILVYSLTLKLSDLKGLKDMSTYSGSYVKVCPVGVQDLNVFHVYLANFP